MGGRPLMAATTAAVQAVSTEAVSTEAEEAAAARPMFARCSCTWWPTRPNASSWQAGAVGLAATAKPRRVAAAALQKMQALRVKTTEVSRASRVRRRPLVQADLVTRLGTMVAPAKSAWEVPAAKLPTQAAEAEEAVSMAVVAAVRAKLVVVVAAGVAPRMPQAVQSIPPDFWHPHK